MGFPLGGGGGASAGRQAGLQGPRTRQGERGARGRHRTGPPGAPRWPYTQCTNHPPSSCWIAVEASDVYFINIRKRGKDFLHCDRNLNYHFHCGKSVIFEHFSGYFFLLLSLFPLKFSQVPNCICLRPASLGRRGVRRRLTSGLSLICTSSSLRSVQPPSWTLQALLHPPPIFISNCQSMSEKIERSSIANKTGPAMVFFFTAKFSTVLKN